MSDTMPAWYLAPPVQISRLQNELAWRNLTVPEIPLDFEPRTQSEILMLNVRLPKSDDKQDSLSQTYLALRDRTNVRCNAAPWHCEGLEDVGEQLEEVTKHSHSTVSWIGYDPEAYQGLSPEQALLQATTDGLMLAGTEVLLGALLFPDSPFTWLQGGVPAPSLSGLRLRTSGWSGVVYLCPWVDGRRIKVRTRLATEANSHWSSPTVRLLS